MNQQQIILQNLREIIRKNRIDLTIKYIEVLVYAVTICFIPKDIQLYKFYKSSLIVFIQGIALTHYYLHIIYQHKKQIQNFGYFWSLPFNNLESYNHKELNNSIILYHKDFLVMRIANLVYSSSFLLSFEIVLFLSAPYEFYRYLKTPLNSYSALIIFEVSLYFARRVQLFVFPSLRLFKFCVLLFISKFRRQNRPIFQNQNQNQPTETVAIQLQEKSCSEIDLECIICLQKITDKYVMLQCEHYYHKECIDHWIKQKEICPLCRSSIN
ncbi:unnamed protein product (macronuclear) [Paramecium tetraurelia]|uniref:RING-type domain-containing protein n=1 Tax=Paramecium tetraurelia TaxID=5888 RepID=A0CMW4_PARTE|nr:uncharacterized protein GSPATT00008572001 [Paramecium tetraurelia]CAK72131.1 unnamed protein product [Paramecium tetraurelia]|eukprot:XP_001439528.1 hypothetical protein (macronuclear) [Paramecium tetraurelia strain d4-2]